jgi:hypothetical protein
MGFIFANTPIYLFFLENTVICAPEFFKGLVLNMEKWKNL